MSEIDRESFWDRCGDSTPRDRENMKWVLRAMLAWMVLLAAATQSIKRGLVPDGPVAWLVAALPAAMGLAVILAYGRFLGQADELQRQIQLQALALGFGGTFFAITGYEVFERLGAPASTPDDYLFAMALLYVLGLFLGWRRYR